MLRDVRIIDQGRCTRCFCCLYSRSCGHSRVQPVRRALRQWLRRLGRCCCCRRPHHPTSPFTRSPDTQPTCSNAELRTTLTICFILLASTTLFLWTIVGMQISVPRVSSGPRYGIAIASTCTTCLFGAVALWLQRVVSRQASRRRHTHLFIPDTDFYRDNDEGDAQIVGVAFTDVESE